jgi:hypothetical protein
MATCLRCKKQKTLIKAHIIPEAFWNLPDQSVGPMAMVSNSVNWKTKPSPIGPYDKQILCEQCDGSIGLLDQHAAENLLRDKSKTRYQNDIVGLYHYKNANAQIIISFIASLVWRASISSHHFFKRVSLGPYETKFFDLQEKGSPIELEESIIINEYDQDTPIMDPHMSRIEGLKTLAFQAERFLFHIKIDQRSFSPELKQVTLHPNREVISFVKSWEESKQKEAMLKIVSGLSKPKFWK